MTQPNNKWQNLLANKVAKNAKPLVYSAVLLTLLLATDYLVNKSSGQLKQSSLIPELPKLTQTSVDLIAGSDVLTLYSQFDQPKVEEVATADEANAANQEQAMSLAEQNQQSGLLDKLYIGDAIYRLSGIVKSGDYKAALSIRYVAAVEQLEDNSTENSSVASERRSRHVSLFVGEKLAQYQVESISNKRLVLNDNGRRLWLELFVPTSVNKELPAHNAS